VPYKLHKSERHPGRWREPTSSAALVFHAVRIALAIDQGRETARRAADLLDMMFEVLVALRSPAQALVLLRGRCAHGWVASGETLIVAKTT
jgi:hypothetical protein